ncbi:hypothetical protein KPH14_012372 [Odynerus spinipes]|uniref:Uncharacterized protein n=1 Tax=Odynerus spinipes TaxID=1348599 RepID=A0AAD9RHX6_9HYME|nr:hypothetical protein KPH14_012372 [Odynerus spinipes]
MSIIPRISYEEELGKSSDLKDSDIEILREWLKKQPHLPKMTDSELAWFLHSNYYQLEPTKTTIDTYYTVRTHVPEFFANRDPLGTKALRQIMQVVSCIQRASAVGTNNERGIQNYLRQINGH